MRPDEADIVLLKDLTCALGGDNMEKSVIAAIVIRAEREMCLLKASRIEEKGKDKRNRC